MDGYRTRNSNPNEIYYAQWRETLTMNSPSSRPPRQSHNSKKNRSRENVRPTIYQDIFSAFAMQTQRNMRSRQKTPTKRIQRAQSPIGKVLCKKAFEFYKDEVQNHKPLENMQMRKQELRKRLQFQIQTLSHRTCSIDRITQKQQIVYQEIQPQKSIIKQQRVPSINQKIDQLLPQVFQQIQKTQSYNFMTERPILTATNIHNYQTQIDMNITHDKKEQKQNSNSLGYSCQLKLQSNFSLNARKSSLSKSSQSLSLKLRSIKLSISNPMMTQTLQKIQIHLTSINYLAQYADWMQQFYKDETQWQIPKYLVYARFSYERERVFKSLIGTDNCFFLKDLQISELQLQMLINNYSQLKQFTEVISKQNNNVQQCLNKIKLSLIKKNLKIPDASNIFLYSQLNREFRILADLLDRGVSAQQQQIYKQRMLSIMQIVFLLQQLQGRYVRGFLQSQQMTFREYMNQAYLDYNQIVTNKRKQ